MKIIREIPTLCGDIIECNVALDFSVYDPLLTYDKDARVSVGNCGSTVYESLVNNNTGNYPETSPLDWLPVGVSNYFAMFDKKTTTKTQNPDSIELVINFDTAVNSAALIYSEASAARFQIWGDGKDYTVDTPDFDETINLRDYGVTSYYEYATYIVQYKENYANFNLPTFVGGTVKLILSNTGSIAKLGEIKYGNSIIIGEAMMPISSGIKDHSTKEYDIFGDTTIVERGYKSTLTPEVLVLNSDAQKVDKFFEDNRAKGLLFSVDESLDIYIIYALYTDYTLTKSHSAYHTLSLILESI